MHKLQECQAFIHKYRRLNGEPEFHAP
jgi:hypothetical protein